MFWGRLIGKISEYSWPALPVNHRHLKSSNIIMKCEWFSRHTWKNTKYHTLDVTSIWSIGHLSRTSGDRWKPINRKIVFRTVGCMLSRGFLPPARGKWWIINVYFIWKSEMLGVIIVWRIDYKIVVTLDSFDHDTE